MRIVFFIDNLLPGGKERRFAELVKGLTAFPHIEFEIVVMNKNIHYREIFDLRKKIHFLDRRIKKDLSVFQRFYAISKRYEPDIIHTWDDMTAIIAIPTCKLLNINLINGMVADTPIKQNILNKTWLRAKLTFPFSNKIIGNSNAGLSGYGAPAKKSVCIYNGMDFRRFTNLDDTNNFRKEILGERNCSNFIVGMVAAFEPRKDYKTLIKAALSLIKSCDSITFILVGDGADFISTKNMVPPEYSDRIIFLGKRSDVESIVNLFDVGVLLTNSKVHGEGISNSLIEYMALGKPVIATHGGGTNEVVIHNQNGYLINPHNSLELVNCVQTLKNDKKLREEFGAKSAEITRNTFDLRIMTKNYIKVYQEVVQAN